MVGQQRASLLESIAQTIRDYRRGEVRGLTAEHVDRWVSQFSEGSQLIILAEMDWLLSTYYVSQEEVYDFVGAVLTHGEVFGSDPGRAVARIEFLQIQRKGNSQRDMLAIADEIAMSRYGVRLQDCGSEPSTYVYLDECIFTGLTALNDIEEWLDKARRGSKLVVACFGVHGRGVRYLRERLADRLASRNVSLLIWGVHSFYNLPWEAQRYDCLWPREISGDALVDAYVAKVLSRSEGKSFRPRLFRLVGTPIQDPMYSSPSARAVLETEFLRAGAYIVSLPRDQKVEMRPMGYEYLESLGFGAVFVTYRNIANNCPLAMWWGNPDASEWNPLSKWYPLFPRMVNEPSSD